MARFFENEDDPRDSRPDYFEGEDLPDTPREKRRRYSDDDPRRWEEGEDPQWDHLRPLRRWRLWAWVGCALLLALVAAALYMRYFRPYAVGGVQYGYVEAIEERGHLFKTYEGTLLPYRNLLDTLRPYQGDFVFTASNVDVAATLRRAQGTCRPVRVEYVQYAATVPWRGDSRFVITRVDSVDARQILPPDRIPPTHADKRISTFENQ